MQDNDLPQIGTPMQTDETRAREVIRADEMAATAYLNGVEERLKSGVKVIEVLPCEDGSPHPLALAFARHRLAFAAPPAVEREDFGGPMPWEGKQPIEDHAKMWRGREWVPLDAAISQLQFWQKRDWQHSNARPLPSSQTLHPSDREAIARVLYDREPACGWRSGFSADKSPRNYAIPWEEASPAQREDAYAVADAILALSPTPSAGRDGGGECVPIAMILPSLEGARATLEHFAKTLANSKPRQLPLAAAFAANEASRLAAAIMLLSPPATEKAER